MKKVYLLSAVLIAIVVIAAVFILFAPKVTAPNGFSDKNDLIRANQPMPGQIIESPLIVSGTARGNWYFEASFPVKLLDGNGKELIALPAQAQGDWMTTEFVPFKATLVFTAPATDKGTLVLQKDNPSGLPEYEDELLIPIRFR